MHTGIEKSSRSGKHEKRGTTAEGSKPGHKARLKKNRHEARQTMDPTLLRPDAFIIPVNPLDDADKRATFSSPVSAIVLPTHSDWGSLVEASEQRGTWSPRRGPLSTPRGKPSAQKPAPTMGHSRKEIQDVIHKLVGSVEDASSEQIQAALKTLERMEGSRHNLSGVVHEYKAKAEAARRQVNELQQRAMGLDEQAAVVQKLLEGDLAHCKQATSALQTELKRRADRQPQDDKGEPVEHGNVEEAKKSSFGVTTFGEATLSLDNLIDVLTRLDEKQETEARQKQSADKGQNLLPSEPLPVAEPGSTSGDKIGRKIAEHADQVAQLEALLSNAKAKLAKWQREAGTSNV